MKNFSLKKRISSIWALCLAVVMVVIMLPVNNVPVMANGDITVRLFYERADGVYDDWDVWMWAAGVAGDAYSFEEEDGKVAATAVFAAGIDNIGFIVRRGDWVEKDITNDQFIEIAGVVSGTVNFYVESGVSGGTLVFGDDVVQGVVIRSAKGDSDVIIVQMTSALTDGEANALEVFDADGTKMGIASIENNDKTITIMLTQELDLYKSYFVRFEGEDYHVSQPNVFSTAAFEEEFHYAGNDLGATWSEAQTNFRVWAPTASSVALNLYESGYINSDDLIETIAMTADVNGTWIAEKEGNLHGIYYTYSVAVGGNINEACDPYARAVGVNGDRAMVINLSLTNPEGWENDKNPNAGMPVNDMIIYELHVRDFSFEESSGMVNKGKYLAFTETGTTNPAGKPTGVDYLRNLGITHLHLLPVYDFATIDETRLDEDQFNWGYDPKNYNVPEGSYSTDPFNGEVRINEFKQMVQALHNNGISVVMDVVYNHTYNADYCFNKIVPGYFYRINEDGSFSNGSGCGNDVASERSMVRKFIVDSVVYWANEYNIDGFRFDLAGLTDIDTMNEIRAELDKIDPSIVMYAEGWAMDTAVTKPNVLLATQWNSVHTPGIAYFSDNIRDGIRGHVFNPAEKGYVNGSNARINEVRDGIFGLPGWAVCPTQVVNYVSAHDNHTLWDKIASSNPEDSFEDRIRQNNLAAAIVFTSQGITFIHAGEEMLRTKLNDDGTFNGNSYKSSSSLNSLKWDDLNDDNYLGVHDYYQGLIELRKSRPGFRMNTADDSRSRIEIVAETDEGVIAYTIDSGTSDAIFVIYNPTREVAEVKLPTGEWSVFLNDQQAGNQVIEKISGSAFVNPISAMVLADYDANAVIAEPAPVAEEAFDATAPETTTEKTPLSPLWWVAGAALLGTIGGGLFYIIRKRK
ncbi:MAG: type I pullulanase [Lachnospiraceae bacterium]|nr:type I pullulanase [Lachnospiraceae bacterium]